MRQKNLSLASSLLLRRLTLIMAIFIFLVSAVEVKRRVLMRKVAKLLGNYKDFHKRKSFFYVQDSETRSELHTRRIK
ncbi:hypothetical protein DYE50_08630 [Treponema ruminis]|nr:hypothetical protein DYE50_08630 [Treponema ruminis]